MKSKTLLFKLNKSMTGILIYCFINFLFASCLSPASDNKNKESIVNSKNKEQYLDWFKEAKFGMFIHWGVYSKLAGEWNGRKLSDVGKTQAEWVMDYLKIPVKDYRELAHQFNPVQYNAREWVKLAKATGMKYIVITAKHHDGFAMYHSKVTDYNIVDWTPYKHDLLKDLSDACAAEGIKFCVYYSHREDWDHPGGYGNNWDYDNEWGWDFFNKDKFNKYLEEKAKPQLRELLSNYGPVGIVWFDRGMYTDEQGKEFTKFVHDLQPSCLVNSRVGSISLENVGDYQCMQDNEISPGGIQEPWETAMTLNDTWGYNKFDSNWKSPETVIRRLVEIISRGGNYLLNIGPTGEGEIPAATVNIFKSVGPWIERNAEAIYGSKASILGEIPWGYSTVKGNSIYLFVRNWPKDGMLTLTGLKSKLLSVDFLSNKSIMLPFIQNENKINLKLPSNPPDNPMTVIELKMDGTPKVEPPKVMMNEKGNLQLEYSTAVTYGKAKTRYNRKGGFHIAKWTSPADKIEWLIHIDKPGVFAVKMTYAAEKEWEGKPFEISNGLNVIKSAVNYTGVPHNYIEFPVGYFQFEKSGNYTLTIKPSKSDSTNLMYLRNITLMPTKHRSTEGWGFN